MDKYTEFSGDELATELVRLRKESKKVENLLVDKQLSETDGLCVQECGSADKIKNKNSPCPMCTFCDNCKGQNRHNFLYKGNKIPNRRNPTDPYYFRDEWKSEDTLKCESFSEGVYAIICVKPDCKYTGVVYFGEGIIRERCLGHKRHINAVGLPQAVHRHFQEHGDKCPLQYFRFVPIKEVLGGPLKRRGIKLSYSILSLVLWVTICHCLLLQSLRMK